MQRVEFVDESSASFAKASGRELHRKSSVLACSGGLLRIFVKQSQQEVRFGGRRQVQPLSIGGFRLGQMPKLSLAKRDASRGLRQSGDALRARAVRPVLTPNAEELGRLLGHEVDPRQEDVLAAAMRYESCVTAQATIADPDGSSWRVPSGHPGLATAGSGDVLAGLVVGLLARSAEPAQAACWGTYLHSVAGERLASAVGGVGFLAR